MTLIATVVAGNPITPAWGNAVRDATVQVCTAATKPSSPAEGMYCYTTDEDKLYVYSGTAWVEVSRHGAWTDFTPTLVVGVTVSKTITYARYIRLAGRAIFANVQLSCTSSGTASNAIAIGLPVAGVTAANSGPIGSFWALNPGGGAYYSGSAIQATTTDVRGQAHAGNAYIGASPAFTVVSGVLVGYSVMYESAA